MTVTETSPASRNGVDTATLFATLNAVKEMPAAAQFQFRAHNEWVTGTHNRSSISDYFGVGEERRHEQTFVFDADHPAVLVGQRQRADSCGVHPPCPGRRALRPVWPTSPPLARSR